MKEGAASSALFFFAEQKNGSFKNYILLCAELEDQQKKINFPKLFLFWFWFLKTWNFCAAHGSGFSF